ncbi:DUF86 domain-containing protein [soil metagenome]
MSVYRRSRRLDDEAWLRHVLDAVRRARELSEGKKLGELAPDDETALALTRLLEILGEAAGRISPALRSLHPDIPWRDISDTRNRVIHQYFDVDMEVVEAIVRDDLPPLTQQLETLLEEITAR